MGWTQTAPTLPSGSSYTKITTGGRKENNVSVSMDVYIARLDKNNVSIRFRMTSSEGEYGTFYPPGWVGFKVGKSTKAYGWGRSVTAYWTGTLNENATYGVSGGGGSTSSSPFDHATYMSGTAKGAAYLTPVYTISYNSNNGAGSTASQSKTWGYAVNLYSCGWSKSGHTFVGWNTAADGSGSSYSAGQSYSTNANLTLYAIWAPNTFTGSYNGNGNTGGTQPAAQTKTYGVALTLRQNSYTKTGHHFVEWNTWADGGGSAYAAGGSFTDNHDRTMYAQWAPDTYAVTFNGNGADGGSQAPATKTYGARLTVPGCTFTRNGYTFSAWNTAADGTGTSYAAGSYYETNAAVTLYAIWIKNNIPVYLNDDGTVRQVIKAYMNIEGTVYEGRLFMNVGGTICEIG